MNLKLDDFPLPDAFPSDLAISISGKELLRGVNKTIYAISKEKTSYANSCLPLCVFGR